uniref:Uncharacterized protein n=1 Tax=Fagus sylvatica TaxID=28930 RepID=A0A2N9FBL8_FAGSY
MNQSSDGRVMTPGSRGAGAVFACFSGEDSGQTGDATGEPRVARRSRSRHLSNAPGLAGQLAASRKDSAREGGCPGEKRLLTLDFDVLGTVGKLVFPSFLRYWTCGESSLGSRDMVPRTGATGVFLVRRRAIFRLRFRLDRGKSWRSESSTLCMNASSFQRAWTCGSTCCESGRLCAQAWQRRGKRSGIFSIALFRQPVFACAVDVAPHVGFRQSWYRRKACVTYFLKVQALHRDSGLTGGALDDPEVARRSRSFVYNSLVSRPVLTRKVSNQSSRRALCTGQEVVSSIQLSVWSMVRSNLGQTWSNSVKLGQSSPNSGKCIPDRVLRVFGCLIEVAVMIIAASSRLWSSCECMNIEGWVVARSVGSECTCIPYFRLSYLIVLTTCSWSLAHLVGLSDALDHSVGRHFLNLRSAWLNLRLFQLIPDGGSTSLISGLSSNFSGRGKIAPVWYNKINEFLIPEASILSPIWEILQEVSIRLDDVDLQ